MALEFILSGFADELTDQAELRKRWDSEKGGTEDRFKVMQEDLETQISTFKEFGVGAIELRFVGGVNVADFTDSELLYIATQLSDAEMQISALGTPDGKIDVQKDLDEHYKQFRRLVEISEMFNGEGVFDEMALRMFSYYNKGPDSKPKLSTKKHKDGAIEQLGRRVDYVGDRRIKLLLENEFELYGDTAYRSRKLIEEVHSGKVRAIDDASNFIHTARESGHRDIDMKRAHRQIAPYVDYVHIKDMDIETGKQTIPGKGSGEIEYLLGTLDRRKSGKMYLSMEPHLGEARVSSGVTPKEKYAEAVAAMKDMIKRVYAKRAA